MLPLSVPMLHTFVFFVCLFPFRCNVLQRVLFLPFFSPRLKVQIASTCPARPAIRARTAACVRRSWTSSTSPRASAATVAEASPAPAARSTWTSAPLVPAPTASATTVRGLSAAWPASFSRAHSRRRRLCVRVDGARAASASARVLLTYGPDRRFFNRVTLAANKSYVMRVE